MDTAQPWYREPWPWLLMAGPATVVVAGIVTIAMAIATDDGVVADDYYKRGLAIDRVLDRVARAQALGLVADVRLAADGRVVVDLSSRLPATDARPAQIMLHLVHPGRAAGDLRLRLLPDCAGCASYTGRVPQLEAVAWRMEIESESWRLPPNAAISAGRWKLDAGSLP